MSEPIQPRILLVDDDPHILSALQRQLSRQYRVTTATNAKEAMRNIFSGEPYAVVVSDLRMPGMDGVSLLFLIRQAAPNTVRVLLTGYADVESAISAVNQGNVFRLLTKPCSSLTLMNVIRDSVELYRENKAREGR
jgi:DNA-binding NtrC family response regulator